MFLDISKLEQGTTQIEVIVPSEEIEFDYRDYSLVGRWSFTAAVTKNSRSELTIKGKMSGTVNVFCDRCLAPFQYKIDHAFETCLIPGKPKVKSGENEMNESELNQHYYTDPIMQWGDVVREQVILNLPFKMLCRESCGGLCAVCGIDLNQTACECTDDEQDPRLLILVEV